MPSATNGGSMKRSSVKPSGRGSRSWSCIARRSPIGPDGPSKKHFHAARSAFRAVYLARLLSSSRRPSAVRSDWRPNASSAAGGASRDGLGLLTPTLLLRRERGHQAGADRGFRRGRKRGVSRDPRRAAPKAFCASSKEAVGVARMRLAPAPPLATMGRCAGWIVPVRVLAGSSAGVPSARPCGRVRGLRAPIRGSGVLPRRVR